MTGTLKSVDQYLNIKLDDISVHEELRYPHLSAVKNVFIRGSVVRYVHLPASAVDVTLLEDAARRGKPPQPNPRSSSMISGYSGRAGWRWEVGPVAHRADEMCLFCRGFEPGRQGEVSEPGATQDARAVSVL